MDFYWRSSEDSASASCLLTVEHFSAEVNLILTVGRWRKLWMDSIFFLYICEKSWIKTCTIPKKRISSRFSSLLICYAILSSLLLQNCVFILLQTNNISLFYRLKSIFSCVNIQEDILCQNAKIQLQRKFLWFLKYNNSNIHFIINDFNRWYSDGRDEYFISLFSLQTSSQAEPFECRRRFGRTFCTDSPRSHSADSGEGASALRTGWRDRTALIDHQHENKNNSIDLFCYKKYIYVFPRENISEPAGVDKDKYTSST